MASIMKKLSQWIICKAGMSGCAPDSNRKGRASCRGPQVVLTVLLLLSLVLLTGCQSEALLEESPQTAEALEEDGSYTSKEDVAAYLNAYGHLPDNFITKKDAKALGWDSREGNLSEVAPGMSIGGDYFGNYEGILPEAEGREYHECDIDSDGGYRGAKRIVFSNDGLIYYTEDHYESFELLYGEE